MSFSFRGEVLNHRMMAKLVLKHGNLIQRHGNGLRFILADGGSHQVPYQLRSTGIHLR